MCLLDYNEVIAQIELGEPNQRSVVRRKEEVTDSFYFNTAISSDDGEKCVSVDDPLFMLFNQQRISQLQNFGDDVVKSWLDDMKKNISIADPLKELRNKMSDSDIIQCVRSRYIQSPNELRAWADYCNRSVDNFNNEIKLAQEKYDAEQAALKEKESVTVNS